jgi:predicted enzyme related to lactoylglutathione lyase
MHAPRLARVAVYVADIEAAVAAYQLVLGIAPARVGPGRVYFQCDGATLVCVEPMAEGHGDEPRPNAAPIYIAVDDLEGTYERAVRAGMDVVGAPTVQPWGERSFYAGDPSGNRLCFVDAATLYSAPEPDSNH